MIKLTWQTITDFHDAPTTCGVYQYWTGDTLLYIGKAVNLRFRLASHAQNAKLDAKEAAIVAGDRIKYTLCDTEFKALMLESELIRKYKPPHNRIWKDDKSYLYIVIDLADPFPRPYFARAHDLQPTANSVQQTAKEKTVSRKPQAVRLFGPFPSAKIAEEVLRAIRRLVPFCMTKRLGKRACFYAHLGLCIPCPSNIQKLTNPDRDVQKRQYRSQIRQIIKILEGNITPVIKDLTLQLKRASAAEDFETALALRTKIERFERFITSHSFSDRHFAYNNSPEKLLALQAVLSPYLEVSPLSRIECYDASNSAIHDSVVSMTVMTDGLLDKGQYRRFKIKNPHARSDFDRLDEALTRRLLPAQAGKNQTWPKPDLIMIDGGVPQLRRLQRVFDRLPNPPLYLGLAKHPDRLIVPILAKASDRNFEIIKLSSDHPGLHLLQELRDEAHRFANSYRKLLEKKRTAI